MNILYGKDLAQNLRNSIKEKIIKLSEHRPPSLAVLIGGVDSASIYYAHLIERAGAKEGIKVIIEHIKNPQTLSLIETIKRLNNDEVIDCILIQLPLPENINKEEVFNTLEPRKDVDGQTPLNLGRLVSKQDGTFPATARAVIALLKGNKIEISGKKAVVIGRSTTVGMPVALMLIHENATVTTCHSKSRPLKEFTRNADILIVSAGVPKIITKEHVKEGAIVIDVGTNEVDGKMVGDVDFDEVIKIAKISPVTGGVGSLTLACLFENTYELYRKNIHSKPDK